PDGRERRWVYRPALSNGSYHPDWFEGVAGEFVAEGTGSAARGAHLRVASLVALALAPLRIVHPFGALTFRTATRDLLPPGQRYATLLTEYQRDFGELDDITVVVEGRTLEESKAYASRLVREIRRGPVKFERVAYRIDPKRFEGRELLYLSAGKPKGSAA